MVNRNQTDWKCNAMDFAFDSQTKMKLRVKRKREKKKVQRERKNKILPQPTYNLQVFFSPDLKMNEKKTEQNMRGICRLVDVWWLMVGAGSSNHLDLT